MRLVQRATYTAPDGIATADSGSSGRQLHFLLLDQADDFR